jgi:hypothetical protein
MSRSFLPLALALAAGLAAPAGSFAASGAGEEGRVAAIAALERFHGTQARGAGDLVGRAVLIEFFAHW